MDCIYKTGGLLMGQRSPCLDKKWRSRHLCDGARYHFDKKEAGIVPMTLVILMIGRDRLILEYQQVKNTENYEGVK
jgi:hypothetical protein